MKNRPQKEQLAKNRQNLKKFDFYFLVLKGQKYVETCSPGEIFMKKSILKNFSVIGLFRKKKVLEKIQKSSKIQFSFFGLKQSEIC